jgi:hypothetical protein
MKFNIFKSETELTEAKAEITRLTTALATKETELTEARTFAEGLADSNRAFGKEIEELKAQVKGAKESAGKQAAEILASVGVPEGTVKTEAQEQKASPGELYEKMISLTDATERRAFYVKHRTEILQYTNNK